MKRLLFLLLPLMTACFPSHNPRDCSEVQQNLSQVYDIYPNASSVKVYCDMDTDQGRWTVFLKRHDGEVNFYRPWKFYKNGFGNPAGEYWLGLENLHQLTKDGQHELRVDLEDFEGNTAFAHYDSFSVGAEDDGYALRVSGFIDGGAGDSMTYHSGQNFSTFDNDQDNSMTNCAQRFSGGFWYNSCYHTNPSGTYQWEPVVNHISKGIIWSRWKDYSYSMKSITMMTRLKRPAERLTTIPF